MYRIVTYSLGIYEDLSAAEAAKVLRWIKCRFVLGRPDPLGWLIVEKDGVQIFQATGETVEIYLPDDAPLVIRGGVERIGMMYAKCSMYDYFKRAADVLNRNPPADYADVLTNDMGLGFVSCAAHRGYLRVTDPVHFEPYAGHYGMGIAVHFRFDGSTRYHGVRYYVCVPWAIRNPFLPSEETPVAEVL